MTSRPAESRDSDACRNQAEVSPGRHSLSEGWRPDREEIARVIWNVATGCQPDDAEAWDKALWLAAFYPRSDSHREMIVSCFEGADAILALQQGKVSQSQPSATASADAEVCGGREALPSAAWRPVSERPEQGLGCLFWWPGAKRPVSGAATDGTGFWEPQSGCVSWRTYSHWMPLPPPPEGGAS